ncbi:hypothetical protein [Streptomyces sp. NPDC059949]|uniref:hypothetical protein n=1 Tax=Streptomyces sp. NPDC059949 TaxID=3347013 RepID=UPI003668835E
MPDEHNPRNLPHRRCQPLHTVYGLVALLAGGGVLLEQPVMALFVIPLALLAHNVPRLVRTLSRRREGKAGPGARVQRAWSAAAVALDATVAAAAFTACAVLLHGSGDVLVLRGRASDYLALGLGLALVATHTYTHVMAARPAGTAPGDA